MLRDWAEEKLARSSRALIADMEEKTPMELVHELQVHQIELEMQNEELKESRFALEESQRKYLDLYDFAPVGYITFTGDALIGEINLTGAALLGLARQKAVNSRFGSFVAPDSIEQWDAHFLSAYNTGKSEKCELLLKREDGSVFYACLKSIRAEAPDGTPVVRTVLTDVTESRRAKDTLQKNEARYRSIIEDQTELICRYCPDGRLSFVNEAYARYYGKSCTELINKDFRPSISEADLTAIAEATTVISRENPTASFEHRITMPDNEVRWQSWTHRGIYTVDGALIEYQAVGRDITHRKHADEELQSALERLKKSLDGTVRAMSLTVEIRDPYTAGHQKRVSNLARIIAQEMGLPNDAIENIRMAGIIHDIGKISVPAEILSKPGILTHIEMGLIMVHPQTGYDILKDVDLPYPIAEIVLQHHERLDGSGYPQGLKGEQILLESRIISIADVIEAISSHRPYRPAKGIDVALEEIEKNKGILYDADVVEICLKLFREKGFKLE